MANTDPIDSLLQQARKLLPAEGLGEELENRLRGLVQNGLDKLDVVSREEFDAQAAVLERAQQKIAELEQQLTELSQQLDN